METIWSRTSRHQDRDLSDAMTDPSEEADIGLDGALVDILRSDLCEADIDPIEGLAVVFTSSPMKRADLESTVDRRSHQRLTAAESIHVILSVVHRVSLIGDYTVLV